MAYNFKYWETSDNEIYHYGRVGMKWRQHIYGIKGALAAKKKERLQKAEELKKRKAVMKERKNLIKNRSVLSNEQLRALQARLQLESSIKNAFSANNDAVAARKRALSSWLDANRQAMQQSYKSIVTLGVTTAGMYTLAKLLGAANMNPNLSPLETIATSMWSKYAKK